MIPKVSIACLTYNHVNYIRKCFEGFLLQNTNFKFEVIVHDDASNDGTIEIIEEYSSKYPDLFFPIFQTHNQRQKGIKGIWGRYIFPRCRGKYIALCEGDDYWTDPNKLQTQVDFLEENPGYVLTSHDAIIVNEKGEMVSQSKLTETYRKDYDSTELMKSSFVLTLTMCFRKVSILNNMPKEYYKVNNEDSFLVSLLGQYGDHKLISSIKPAAYRVHANGIWSMKGHFVKKKSQINTLSQLRKYYSRMGDKKMELYFSKTITLISTKLLYTIFKEKKENKILFLFFYVYYNRILNNPIAYFKRLHFFLTKNKNRRH